MEPDIAGPSGNNVVSDVTDADLAAADRDFCTALQALRENDLGRAIELFGKVLETRIAKYGDTALECASAYYRYGSSLFYQAQEESDIFGAPLQQAAKEQRLLAQDVHDEKENINGQGKGKDKVLDQPPPPEPDDEDEDDEGDANAGEEPETDMQLAWQMLEIARTIYSQDAGNHAAELADVHLQLGDISMEEENFDAALSDYRTALKHRQHVDKVPDRRAAELQYKMALALQYLNDPAEALAACQAALSTCKARLTHLRHLSSTLPSASSLPTGAPIQKAGQTTIISVVQPSASQAGAAPGAGTEHLPGPAASQEVVPEPIPEPAAKAVQEAPPGESSGLQEEPREVAVQGSAAVESLGVGPDEEDRGLAGSSADDAPVEGPAGDSTAPAQPAAPEGAPPQIDAAAVLKEISDLEPVMEELKEKMAELKEAIAVANSQREMVRSAFSQLSGVLGGAMGGPLQPVGGTAGPNLLSSSSGGAREPAAAAVQDLGVVGRGRKRIQLQPVPIPQNNAAPSAKGDAGPPAAPPAKPKRSLEDLMGSANGESHIGFGNGNAPGNKKLKPDATSGAASKNAEAATCPNSK
eukprot:jgi/Botrbrau1/3435/Bobra.139_1s0015.1